MKRLPIFVKILLLLVCVSFGLSAYNAGSVVNNTLIIPYMEMAPVIDGENTSNEWDSIPQVGMFVHSDPGNNPEGEGGAADFSSYFRVAYNEDAIYFLGTVIDDSIYTAGTNSYEQDCFEIYFDGDNSKGGSYDANDIQWRWVYGVDTINPGWADAGAWAWFETTDGWQFELVISQDSLNKAGTPLFDLSVTGDTIGFEVQVADNDTNARDWITKWWNASNSSWQEPQLFGTAILGDADARLEIENMALPPVIDGENTSGEWDAIPLVHMKVNTDNDLPDGGFMEFACYYKAAWSTDAFYFFGNVIDDVIYTAGTNSYEQDCWELYFDGDNSKGGSYDANDIQWRWVYGVDTLNPGWTDAGAWAWATTDSGYTFELVISQDSLNKAGTPLFTLAEGAVIGWETQVSDNDTNARDCIAKWWNASNASWQEPQLFGTAELVDSSTTIPHPGPVDGIAEIEGGIELSVPAVLNAAGISYSIPARSSVKLVVYNLAGQAVETAVNGVQNAGTYSVSVGAGLANGVYIIKLDACNTSTAAKALVLD